MLDLPTLKPTKLQQVDAWFAENVVEEYGRLRVRQEEVMTRYTPRRIGARTHHYKTHRAVRVPFKAPTLAAYLAAKRPDLDVDCQDWTERYGRQGTNGVYYSHTDRSGYRVTAKDPNNLTPEYYMGKGTGRSKPVILLDHTTTDTYRTADELVVRIAELLQ